MARVIVNYSEAKPIERVKECPFCGSLVAYLYKDLLFDVFHNNRGMLMCPRCKKTFTVGNYKSTETM